MDTDNLREGIAINKGFAITEQFLEQNEELLGKYVEFFATYPDLYLDTIASKNCPIHFYYYQRILMRAMMRYRFFYGGFTRATSKSFLAIITEYLACVFMPRSKRFVVSQFKKASLSITKQKLEEIWTYWPLLKEEILTSHMASDYIDLIFKNGSNLQILALSASSRGNRATGGTVEEAALVDGSLLAEVIIPMMNIPRMTIGGGTNPTEPHAQQKYITSAGTKASFAYERLIELTALAVIAPEDYFICGADYKLPLHYGLFDAKTIQDQKLSTSFSSDGFARESLSIWTGGSSESWFNAKTLDRSRTLLSAEKENRLSEEQRKQGYFYEIAIDVARTGFNETSIAVLKVRPRARAWKKDLVYTENLSNMNLMAQAARIKELYTVYRPREIVIDANGVGQGLADALVVPSYGPHGESYGPLYVKNDPDSYPYPKEETAKAIVYNMKANASLNSEIYSNLYVQFTSGNIGLLAKEAVIRDKLMTTKSGQQMNYLQRERFLLPYIMTSRLIDELNNLRLKSGSVGQVAVEQITHRINKDRVSALSYGLFRIKYYEDKEIKKKKSGLLDATQMTFFSSKRRK